MRKKFQVRDRPLKSRTWKFQVYEWRHEIRVQKSRDLQKKTLPKKFKIDGFLQGEVDIFDLL